MADPAFDPDPIILTLVLDEDAHAWFDQLRRRYFPPERLQVGAHVTLFHALPGQHAAEILACVSAACSQASPHAVQVTGLRFLGRGVAFTLEAPQSAEIRRGLARRYAHLLTAQDQAKWSGHVTIQNKVSSEVARQTQAALSGLAVPHPVTALGIVAWRYRGGPWQAIARYAFGVADSH